MNINSFKSVPVIAAALLLGSVTAVQAQETGLYIGAGWGSYSINENNLDNNDDVIKTLVGIQFNGMFGIEGSWTDFNRINNGGDRFEADGRGLSAVLSFPVGTASAIFVKGGQFWWDSDAAINYVSQSSHGNDLFWGAGLKLGFNDALALRLEVERYDVMNAQVRTLTAGLDYRF
jgi:hypothetical protein